MPGLGRFLGEKSVPSHRYTFFYLFGGLALFLVVLQFITGILLSLYYSPSPDTANESVRLIISDVNFGWLVRSIHAWGAHAIVLVVLIHLASTFFMGAYKRPRELVWVSGLVILFFILGFAFTGYLLPWDTTAYFATQIGTEIPKSLPIVGELTVTLLRGGEEIGREALQRMYTIHTILLPLLSIIFISFHVLLQQFVGTSTPPGYENHGSIRFYPDFLYRDGITWGVMLIIVLGFSTMLPVGVGEKVDPLASAPVGIRPEWYFLPLYQTLRMFPAQIASLNGEMIVNIMVATASASLFFLPFLPNSRGIRRAMTVLGIIVVSYFTMTIILAYVT